jgi:hypothetical protein
MSCTLLRFSIVLVACGLLGCNGKANCQSTCKSDDDCVSGLSCLAVSNGSLQCLPPECAQCSEGQICHFTQCVTECKSNEDWCSAGSCY